MASSGSTSASFYGIGDDELHHQLKPQLLPQALPLPLPQNPSSAATSKSAAASAPAKKRRNLPGVTVPDAEIIALSPRSLLATNRFICEVCNKGFQREQNLQLHRRGHNLPWKLRQKSPKEVRKRMYLCPEPTCVHHDPSRALGDLTGIKKHFSRKHGEKKWKCEKCSKRYAVQSDLKAHSKTCGTREYRCDCGTLFSRRDSFITHRAFCDALAQESVRLPTGLTSLGSHLFASNNMQLNLSQVNSHLKSLQDQAQPSPNLLRLGGRSQFDQLISNQNAATFRPPASSFYFNEEPQSQQNFLQTKPNFHGLMQLPDLQTNATGFPPSSSNLFGLNFLSNSNNASDMSSTSMTDQYSNVNGSMDANTLFSNTLMSDHIGVNSQYNSSMQSDSMIPQMSATSLLQKAAQIGSKGAVTDFNGGFGGSGINEELGFRAQIENEIQLQSLMNSLANGNSAGCFNNAFSSSGFGLSNANIGVSDRLTRDFLGVGGVVRSINGGMPEQHHHGIELGSFDQDIKMTNNGRSFVGGGSM